MSAFPIAINPLITKSIRERLRLKNALSWGVVIVVVTAFIYGICHQATTNYLGSRDEMAAKFALTAILMMQAVILMLAGTGSVAEALRGFAAEAGEAGETRFGLRHLVAHHLEHAEKLIERRKNRLALLLGRPRQTVERGTAEQLIRAHFGQLQHVFRAGSNLTFERLHFRFSRIGAERLS